MESVRIQMGEKYITLGFRESIMKDVVSSRTSKMSSGFQRRQCENLMCRSSHDMEAINPQDRPKNRKQFCLISVLVQFNLTTEYSGKSFFFPRNDKPESNIEFPYNPEQFKVFEQGSDKSKIFFQKNNCWRRRQISSKRRHTGERNTAWVGISVTQV